MGARRVVACAMTSTKGARDEPPRLRSRNPVDLRASIKEETTQEDRAKASQSSLAPGSEKWRPRPAGVAAAERVRSSAGDQCEPLHEPPQLESRVLRRTAQYQHNSGH